ncbi:hypothetical protein PROFUN_09187 [Planoprotostelium fungivorum]|uniref:Glucose-repressible protein n=1 Tax=Planoprotostelium fungivorum TaxID=1890364 RepID=A0A2P6N2T8_9EUKA|nr:hypothetical protein PROFUN_13907 [Planoprotostelium fungivorum]PRP83414.1 hypothetical protein PROFUN_09187 [Planoprotostelium fungivorum]
MPSIPHTASLGVPTGSVIPLTLKRRATRLLESERFLLLRRLPSAPSHHHNINTHKKQMETIKNAANYVAESVQGAAATTSKEANKEVAKDSDQSIGTRLNAGVDALKDKSSETSHDAKAEAYKQKATH